MAMRLAFAHPALAQAASVFQQALFKNVNVLDGKSEKLAMGQKVLVEGNPIDDLRLLMNKDNIPVIMKDGKTTRTHCEKTETVDLSRACSAPSTMPGSDTSRTWIPPARTRDRAASTSSSRPAMKVIQKEPLDMLDPETRGLFASIGIEKGKPFRPDERMKKILTDAVAIDFTANSQQKVAVGAHD